MSHFKGKGEQSFVIMMIVFVIIMMCGCYIGSHQINDQYSYSISK